MSPALIVWLLIGAVNAGAGAVVFRRWYKKWRAAHPRPITPPTPAPAATPATPATAPWWKRALIRIAQLVWPVGKPKAQKKNAWDGIKLAVEGGIAVALISIFYYVDGGYWPTLIMMIVVWFLYLGRGWNKTDKGGRVPYHLVALAFAALIYWTVPWGIRFWRPVPDHGRALHHTFMDVVKKESLVGDYYVRKARIGKDYHGKNNAGVVDYCYERMKEFADAAGGRWPHLPTKPNDMRWCFELCKLGHDLLEDAPVLRGCQGDYKKGACNRTQALDQLISSYEQGDRNALYGGSNGCDEQYGAFENDPDAP